MVTKSKLNEVLERFADEIEMLVRDDVTAKVLGALAGDALAHSHRIAKSALDQRAPVRKGGKRTPEELEQLAEKLRAYIGKHPGERIEQIGVGMGISTKELVLPARKLIADGKVKTKGQKRSTNYTLKA